MRILDSVHFTGINFEKCDNNPMTIIVAIIRFASNVEITNQYKLGSSGGNTVVPFKRGVACTFDELLYLQSNKFMRVYFLRVLNFAFLCNLKVEY